MYMSSSDGQPGLLAILETMDEYPPSEGVCYLRLWHYMHTDLSAENVDIGTLRVYLAGMACALTYYLCMHKPSFQGLSEIDDLTLVMV